MICRRYLQGIFVAVAMATMMLPGQVSAQTTIGFDDFEGLNLEPFGVAGTAPQLIDLGQGGLDWTRDIRSGTPRAWTVDNSLMDPAVDPNAAPAYYGWAAWNFAAWFVEQGDQDRGSACTDLAAAGNICLVADPDAMDDFSNVDPDLYDSSIQRTYNLTGDLSMTAIELKYEFRNEDLQEGWIEVSFDAGATWQLLKKMGPAAGPPPPPEYEFGCPETWSVQNGDFTADSSTMILRFRLKGGNDWWFAVDDILVTTDSFTDFEDFEGLTLEQFTLPRGVTVIDLGQGGMDFTKDIRTGTPREWTIDNSMTDPSIPAGLLPGYYGWSAWNFDAWFTEQGDQGRGSQCTALATPGNTCLVVDPDALDDYVDIDPDLLDTSIQRTYELTGDLNQTAISLIYEFRNEDSQEGWIEVSFDGGTTWQLLQKLGPEADAPGEWEFACPATWTVQNGDFTADSSTLILRLRCVGGNDWWFAVDDVLVTTDTFNDFENFEGLALEPLVLSNLAGDGTDWTKNIPNWTVDNSGNGATCLEEAYNGFSAIGGNSWVDQQGDEGGNRSLLLSLDPTNTVLVCDGDAFADFVDPPNPGQDYINSYITREYSVGAFDVNTIEISFLYDFRVKSLSTAVTEVSFDNGTTWTRLLELDENDGADDQLVQGLASFSAGVDFTPQQSSTMLLRFGFLEGDDDWWFAIDDLLVEGDPLPITFPDTITTVQGVNTGGDLNSVLASDNTDYTVQRSPQSASGIVTVEVEASSPTAAPTSMDFTCESSGFYRTPVIQNIELFDFVAGAYVNIDASQVSRFADGTVTASGSGDLSRFVEGGTNRVKARLQYTTAVRRQSYSVAIDHLFWNID